MVRLTAPDTAAHYAASLYRALREADALHLTTVYAVPPTGTGVEAAIRDRLERAAHGIT
jgi:L-threonylcarbamoyladenylate synthase